ncbi:MAG: lipd A biosynthesis protein [Muribaculaceae bacterium]|nr:lipd A biosynthesis protein [Muribaculaceae bacterium]
MKYKIVYGLLKLAAMLPLCVLYRISDLAGFILYHIAKYRLKVVRQNLEMAFPEMPEKERRRIERKFYRHLCDIFIETAKLAHVSNSRMLRRVNVEGAEFVNDAVARGKSVTMMLGHFGNWEWVTVAALKFNPEAISCEIYHPLRDKMMDRLMLKLRSRFGTENIPMAKTFRRLVELNKSGRTFVCGFIADQRPFTPVLKHWTDFLGIDTAYVDGGEVIGTRLDTEFVYAEMMPRKRGHYDLRITPLLPLTDGEPNPYTRAYLQRLESSIRQCPWAWLWSHNRWKRKRNQ